MNELLTLGANALRKAALNKEAKEFILNDEVLFQTLKKAANRYIGGETLDETVAKVIEQNRRGLKCSIEFMGENTSTSSEAILVTQEFIRIAKKIQELKLHSTISLDLSHIGLNLSKELCIQNLDAICTEAKKGNIEVIISAEEAEKTDDILHIYELTQKTHNHVSITLQAYLHRTKDDFQDMIKLKGRIRMVKGAFDNPESLSLPRGEKLDEIYLYYVEQLLSQKHLCSIATHHHKIQQAAKALIEQYKPEREIYEFESLYGIQTGQLQKLKEEGHPAKLYFVYGKQWYLYLCNRIAEYPLNIFQALDDMVKPGS